MEYDSIPFQAMVPDAPAWTKGLRIAQNVMPTANGGWREIGVPTLKGTVTLSAGTAIGGTFSDPAGPIWVGVTRSAGPTSRLYEYTPSTETWTNRTPGTDFGGAPAAWSFTKFGTSIIAAPANNGTGTALQLQVRSGSGNFANLVTSVDRPAPKYVSTCKGYVVAAHNLANGGAGLYASANPYQVMWSSRNNAAVWTPGTDRAGFAPNLSDDLGEITGVLGFKDFFLVFQQFGATRFTWVGGDAVWEAQDIASGGFGLPAAWSSSLIRVSNRDAAYFSNAGPAIVQNGEAAGSLSEGVIQRHLMDQTGAIGTFEYSLDRSKAITAVLDTETGAVIWGAYRFDNAPVQIILSGDRWSVVDAAGIGGYHLGAALTELPAFPLEQMYSFTMAGNDLQAYRFKPATRAVLPIIFQTFRWRGKTGQRVNLHSIRPLLLLKNASTTAAYPAVTVLVTPYQDFREAAAASSLLPWSSRDENGWITSEVLPMSANEFVFQVAIPNLNLNGATLSLRDLVGLEIAFGAGSVF